MKFMPRTDPTLNKLGTGQAEGNTSPGRRGTVPSYDETYYVKVSDVLESLEAVQEDSAVLLHERCSGAYSAIRTADDLQAARECVEWEAYADGFKSALELVHKHFLWLEEEKRQRDKVYTQEQ